MSSVIKGAPAAPDPGGPVSQQPDGQAQQAIPIAVSLAYVCHYWNDIREVLTPDIGDGNRRDPVPMRRLADAVRTGADLRGPLEAVHTALQDADDPLGVWGAARTKILAGVDRGVPFEPVYSCPRSLCAGHIFDTAAAISFTCALTGQPLRKDTL